MIIIPNNNMVELLLFAVLTNCILMALQKRANLCHTLDTVTVTTAATG